MAYTQKSLLNTNRVKEQNENNIVRDISHLIGFTEDLETRIDGQNEFAELEDVNVTYTGNAGKVIAINATEDGVEAITISTANLYTSNGTLTANRTVTGAGFSLKFTGQSNFSIVSPSSSSLDTALAVRNDTDTSPLLNIQGNGRADFYGDIYARSEKVYLQDLWSLYFNYNALQITSGLTYTSRGEVGVAYTQHNFTTTTPITTAGSYLMKVSNGGALKMSIDKDGSFKTISPSASALDTAFGIRNNTDTSWLSRTLGDGSSETLTGSHSFGITVNTSYRLYAYTSSLTAAFRGYHDGNSGIGIIAQADGSGGIGIQAQALNAGGGTGARISGKTNSLLFSGGFQDDDQNTTPTFPQATVAGEAALLATLSVGKWYYLDNADGTGTVKVKL